MTATKSAISFVLLMVYTIGLVQGMTPRCNHFEETAHNNQNEVHHHEHHDHGADEAVDHAHIEHNGHLDAGTFDLLICILEDVAHSERNGDGCHCVPSTSLRASADWVSKLKLLSVAVLELYFNEEPNTETEHFIANCLGELRLPQLTGLTFRGPPSIS